MRSTTASDHSTSGRAEHDRFEQVGVGVKLPHTDLDRYTDWEAVASVTVPMVEVVHAGVAATAETAVFRNVRVDCRRAARVAVRTSDRHPAQ